MNARSLGPRTFLLAVVLAGCPRETETPRRVLATPPSASATAMPMDAPTGPTVKRLDGPAPLTGYRAEAKTGDYVLANEGNVAVVSATTGRLLDFGVDGGQDELVAIEPSLSLAADGAKTERLDIDGIEARAHEVEARWRVVGARLTVRVIYTFHGEALRIESTLASSGDAVAAAHLGEQASWGNVPTWVEGHGDAGGAGAWPAAFVGRDALGVAYALGADGGAIARFSPPSPGFWQSGRTTSDVGGVAAGGASRPRVAWLARGISIGHAAMALPSVIAGGVRRVDRLLPFDYELARDVGGAIVPFAPFRPALTTIDAPVPSGARVLRRFVVPGLAPGPWLDVDARDTRDASPRAGYLAWRVTERGGGALPARIVVRGVPPTPDPSWGEDPHAGAVLNVVYADRDGSRELAPGDYVVTVSRGFEYTARELKVTIADHGRVEIKAELERVVDTRGWITADLHLHAAPSPDAPTLLADRIRSLAAAGVEVGVATDHNAITDYAPTIRELGLGKWVASIVGDEITTKGDLYGHFNLFPLAIGQTPVPFDHTTPPAIFAAARAAARDAVLQVNHPRMGDIGYFDVLGFDPKDVAGWRAKTKLAAMDFDAIEVFNGDHYDHLGEVEKCLRDWYALLDSGMRVTATGNSDSHKLAYHEAGVPWNYVHVADDPAKLDERAFVEAIRAGRVVVSSGPFVRMTANGREIGDTVAAGTVEVAVRVDAPPWVDVDRVELVGRGGAVLKAWTIKSTAVTRLDAHAKLALTKGDWIVAVARGKKPMTALHRAGAMPFAFTNPIRVE